MRSRFVAGFALLGTLLTLNGCGAKHYAKKGDQAAATGDWETAEAEYRTALHSDPNQPGLKEKYDHAKTQAMAQAKQRANQCLSERNYPCATQQADYAASLDSADGEAQSLRSTAHQQYGLSVAQQAQAMASSDPNKALDMVAQARGISNDPQTAQAANQAQSAAVQTAISQAAQLRQQAATPGSQDPLGTYDRAIAMLDHVAKFDPRGAQEAANARNEKQHWVDAEYQRLIGVGDQAGMHHDWNAATQQYQAADRLRPNGPAHGLVNYAQACLAGDTAFTNKDLAGARAAYVRASQLPEDGRLRYAQQQIGAVDQAITQEYERLAGIGDQSLEKHDWQNAIAQYQAAEHLRAGGRAKPMIDYCNATAQGDAAVAKRDWKGAADAYRVAANMPFDRDHYAATQIDRVEIRPYWITVKTIVVKPIRADLTPWVGRPSVDLAKASGALLENNGSVNWHAVSMVPAENVPTFQVEFSLPDGRRFVSSARQGVAPNISAGLLVESNGYDERTLTMKIQQVPSSGPAVDVESVTVPLADLLAKHKRLEGGNEVLSIESTVEVAKSGREGDVAGMTLIAPPSTAQQNPPPGH